MGRPFLRASGWPSPGPTEAGVRPGPNCDPGPLGNTVYVSPPKAGGVMATRCRTSGLLAPLAAILILAPSARAHVRLESPASRYGDEMKSRPCGRPGGVRTTRVTTVRPGQAVTVIFDEIIDHPGYFRIAFDRTGDSKLGPPVWNGAVFVNPSNVEVLVDHIPNPSGLTHGERRV